MGLFDSLTTVAENKKKVLDKADRIIERIERFNDLPPSANSIIDFLEERYIAPASTKELGHGREVGGLLLHELRVAHNALQFADRKKEQRDFFNKVVLLSLVHDLGKLMAYRIYDKPIYWHWKALTRDLASGDDFDDLPLGVRRDASARHGQLSLYVLPHAVNEKQMVEDCGGEEGHMDVLCATANFHATFEYAEKNDLLQFVSMGDAEDAQSQYRNKLEELVDTYLGALKTAFQRDLLVYDNTEHKRNAGELHNNTFVLYLSHQVNQVVNEILRERGATSRNLSQLTYIFEESNYEVDERSVEINKRETTVTAVKIPNFFQNR